MPGSTDTEEIRDTRETGSALGTSAASDKDTGNKAGEKKAPLIRYEPDSAHEPKLWLAAAICLAVCSAVYVAGIVIPSAVLVGGAMAMFLASAAVLLVFWRKIRASVHVMKENEIDALVEQYKEDLVDTFNGYDVDYTAEDVLIEADRYRKHLERENSMDEIEDDESMASVLRGAFRKNKKGKKGAGADGAHERKTRKKRLGKGKAKREKNQGEQEAQTGA